MYLIVLFGPSAVGKMAVGQELRQLTGFPLFHNHMALEPVMQIFPFDSPPFSRIVRDFRNHIFKEVAESDLPGFIFTFMWALDLESEKQYMDEVCDLFESNGASVHFVELYASLEERLRRNRTAERLAEKPSKRDVEASDRRLLMHNESYKLNSNGDFFYPDRHIWIDNTHRATRDVAAEIVDRLGLPTIDANAESKAAKP